MPQPPFPTCDYCGVRHAPATLCRARPSVAVGRRYFLGLLGTAAAGLVAGRMLEAETPAPATVEIPEQVLYENQLGISVRLAQAWPGEPPPLTQLDHLLAVPTLQPGDIFTIEGKFALNPRTRMATAQLQEFVVVSYDPQTMSVISSPKPARTIDVSRLKFR